MKTLIFFIIYLVTINLLESQDLYSIKQKCNSENILIEKLNLQNDEYKVIIVFENGACPRCESIFKPLEMYLIDNKIDYRFVPKFNKVISNLNQNVSNFNKVIVDSLNIIYNLFTTDPQNKEIRVPHIIKIDSKGNMIYQKSTLGIDLNQKIIREIISSKKNYECSSYILENPLKYNIELNRINIHENLNTNTVKFNSNCDTFAFINSNINEITIRRFDDLNVDLALISTLEEEMEYFNKNFDKAVFELLKANNIIKVIYLDILNISHDTISIIASLPKIIKEPDGYGYYNEPSLIKKTFNNKLISIETIGFESELENNITYAHGEISYLDSVMCFKTMKGWPVVGTKSTPDSVLQENLNFDVFYRESPLFVCKCGLKHFFIKNLSDIEKCLKTGYYFNFNHLCLSKNNFYFTRGYDGIVEIISRNNPDYEGIKIEIFPFPFKLKDLLCNNEIHSITDLEKYKDLFENRIEKLFFSPVNNTLFVFYKINKNNILTLLFENGQKKEIDVDLLAIDDVLDICSTIINNKTIFRLAAKRRNDLVIYSFTVLN